MLWPPAFCIVEPGLRHFRRGVRDETPDVRGIDLDAILALRVEGVMRPHPVPERGSMEGTAPTMENGAAPAATLAFAQRHYRPA
jgi:hypothetical protein